MFWTIWRGLIRPHILGAGAVLCAIAMIPALGKENAVSEWEEVVGESLDGPCWRYTSGTAKVWISPRPRYCDRGHWIAHCDGVLTLDSGDCFPRYYMDLERAKLELQEWLDWRMQCEGGKRRLDRAAEMG